VKEPVSAEDCKGSTAAVEDSLPGSSSSGHAAKGFTRTPPFLATVVNIGPEHADFFGTAPIVAQEIPKDIRRHRDQLSDFYAKWKKEMNITLRVEDEYSIIGRTPIEHGVIACEKLFSKADEISSAYSQVASIFLLCANAYPRHATVCYILAESCFNMAKISSRLISASWKLCHGFTMSLMTCGLREIRFPLIELMGRVSSPLLWYLQLYADLMDHVKTNMSLQGEEEFQGSYKQLPADIQISVFTNVLGKAEDMFKQTMDQIRQLAPTKLGQPEKKKLYTSCSLVESDKADFVRYRPKQKEVSATSSARESKDVEAKSEGDRPEKEEVYASSSCDEEDEEDFEESEIGKKLCDIKSRINSYVGEIKVLCELLRSLKIAEC
jgi:hypothetical protein